MSPYGCLATGRETGLIEVVQKASTIMDVQLKHGFAAGLQIANTALHNHLREKSLNTNQYVALPTSLCTLYTTISLCIDRRQALYSTIPYICTRIYLC